MLEHMSKDVKDVVQSRQYDSLRGRRLKGKGTRVLVGAPATQASSTKSSLSSQQGAYVLLCIYCHRI